jgi:hypothetical protein
MYKESVLSISGFQNGPVPNHFFRQDGEADTLAVILPGYGYNADMPLLYYAGLIAIDQGMDLMQVETAYNRRPEFSRLSDPDRTAWLDADADAAFDAALAQRAYKRLVLIGKSLGTMAMGHLLGRYPSLSASRWVWLTPVLNDPRLVDQIQRHRPTSFFAIGTKDRYYDEDALFKLVKATQGKLTVIPGADHGLEIPGNIPASVQALEQVMVELETFL